MGARLRLWIVGAVAAMLAAFVVAVPSASAAGEYVAMGDSYTAGPLIPVQIPPFGCLKSNNDYPHLAAPQLGVDRFVDISCSGAKTKHFYEPQDVDPDGPNPPQFSALTPATTIVSWTMGGNDIGFSEIIEKCRSTTPEGHPCQDHYVRDGRDIISERIQATAPKIAKAIQDVKVQSPLAEVYVVNYLRILPKGGFEEYAHCWPQMPVAWDDIPYLRAKQDELNDMIADQAAANGAHVVDVYRKSTDHDACQPPGIRWVEPFVPANAAAPVHPNLFGMQASARELVKTVRKN